MIIAIKKSTLESLADPDQEGVRHSYPSVSLGTGASYEDDQGEPWLVYSHEFSTDMVARLASMAVNLSELAQWDSQTIQEGGLTVVRDGSRVPVSGLRAYREEGETKSPRREALEEAREALAAEVMEQLRNNVSFPIDEGPHDTAQAALEAQEPQSGALSGTLKVFDAVPSAWSRVEDSIA